MTRKIAFLTTALPWLALLSACGDDLESRKAAAGVDTERPPEMTIEQSNSSGGNTVVATEGDTAFDDETDEQEDAARSDSDPGEDDEEETVVDASPDDLIDSAQGFAAEPMDDAQGFDPSPAPPENFGD